MEIILGSWRLAIEQVIPTVDELSEKYNEAAPNWHQSIERMGFIDAYRSMFSQLLAGGQSIGSSGRLSILDVGIGTGGLSQALIEQEPRPIDLTGVDISAQMLALTKSNIGGRLRSLRLLHQNIQRLQIEENRFDLVMGAHVLEHLPDMRQGLREMVRVAKPGAPVLLVVTRRSLASAWLHLIWQLKTASKREVIDLFDEFGLENVEQLKFKRPLWCNWMSVAIVGWKPV